MANINKNQIGYNEALSAGTANSLMVQYRRANAAPLDISEVFTSISAASDYAKSGPTAYAGQVIAVAGEDIKTEVYTITSASTIVRLVDEFDLLEVETSAGKIDEIKVNGSPLEIDGKSVNIDLSGYVTNNQLSALVSTDTGKTIREIANDEIASKLISSDAKESLDTLEEIAAWIQAHPEDAASMNESIVSLEKSAHTHTNKDVLDGITSDKVSAWDATEQNVKDYVDGLAGNYDEAGAAASAETAAKAYADSLAGNYDVSGSAASALEEAKSYADGKATSSLSSAKSYVDGKVDGKFDTLGSAASAETAAKAYADSLAGNYDKVGSAASAETAAKAYTDDEISKLSFDTSGSAAQALIDAKAYVDGKVDGKFDALGSAASAETAAKAYADSLAGNYDTSGAADKALEAAKDYADGLAGNYDSVGSAAGALSSAKAYADGLASNYDKVGSAASAETAAKAYVDTKLVDYATQSFVTDKIVSALTNGTVDITGYAKIEVVNELDANVYTSAKTYTDESISSVEEELNWIYANDENVKEKIRHWRGTREKYEFLKRNGALNAWTKYVVIDTNNGKDTIVEYYGENQVYELTGQLLPVKDIIEGISSVTAAPYDRYLVGRNSIGYNIYECVLDDENNLKWYIKPFDYRYGVRVISRGLKNYVYFDGELITYDEIDGGVF